MRNCIIPPLPPDRMSTVFNTALPAASLEFCPLPEHADLFVCGTYKLEDTQDEPAQSQNRHGECLLFCVDPAQPTRCRLLQKTSLPGVLDMKWCHASRTEGLLAVADSEGNVSLHTLKSDRLESTQAISCAKPHVLALSLDWSDRRSTPSTLGNIAVSLSSGALCILRPSPSDFQLTEEWAAHDYESWIVAWNYWNDHILYSGGDDLKLKGWDVREGFDRPTFVNVKSFTGGVTTIQSHPHTEHLLAVGSYDEYVRLFDTRNLLRPLSETHVDGGVWRAKWHPSIERKDDLLLACMHAGCRVVRYNDAHQGETISRFEQHQSMAYGADWQFSVEGNKTTIASCSFYDQALYIWDA